MAYAKLTAGFVKGQKTPGRYNDGDGLYLDVRAPIVRYWMFRWCRDGRSHWLSLGATRLVTLAEARDRTRDLRRLLLDGGCPLVERRRAKLVKGKTFKAVADRYLAEHTPVWSPLHAKAWQSTISDHAAALAPIPVAAVTTEDVCQALRPIWLTRAITASRLRSRIEIVLDYATSHGWRRGDNPARWKGHLENLMPSQAKLLRVVNHPALPHAEMPAFMATLRAHRSTAALALEFLILTATRTGEVTGAAWSEIDFNKQQWTIPAGRMKMDVEHRVPLSAPALAVLAQARRLPGPFVFPGKRTGTSLSPTPMLRLLTTLGFADVTVHGFRSTFRDWSADMQVYSKEVCQAALAHTIAGNKAELAYLRTKILEKRVDLMADWAEYCATSPARLGA